MIETPYSGWSRPMTCFELRFHAERDELIDIAQSWMQRHVLSVRGGV